MIKKTTAKKVTTRKTVKKPVTKSVVKPKTNVRKNTLKGQLVGEKTKEITFNNVKFSDGDTYKVIVSIRLGNKPEGKVFSVSADVKKGRDFVMGGQCLDTIYEESELRNNRRFAEIYDLWKKYHLNDLHAGTPAQEKAINEHLKRTHSAYDYTSACEYLKRRGLYEVPYQGKSYKYGTSWLFEKIPENDLRRIEALF